MARRAAQDVGQPLTAQSDGTAQLKALDEKRATADQPAHMARLDGQHDGQALVAQSVVTAQLAM